MRLTEQAHQQLKQIIEPGDAVIDATCGHGHDTLFLSQCVGNSGHIFAFDVQIQAIQSAQNMLIQQQNKTPITWLHSGHEHMLEHIPRSYHHHIKAITFNLGYLPHSDKNRITTASTTLTALNAASKLLTTGGALSVLAYTGHAGGREEAEAVKTWAHSLTQAFEVSIQIPNSTKYSPPEWIYISKT
ncbi:MAG: class I SAM-dependent methyltransferase [Mariprofundaceae bacterium]